MNKESSHFIPIVTRPDGTRRIIWDVLMDKPTANAYMRRQRKFPRPDHYNFVSERQAKRIEKGKKD